MRSEFFFAFSSFLSLRKFLVWEVFSLCTLFRSLLLYCLVCKCLVGKKSLKKVSSFASPRIDV